jgi:ATP-dependent DNA ligase
MARSLWQDARGVADFEALQAALRSQPTRLIFYAFDLLHLDGKNLLDRPLVENCLRTHARSISGKRRYNQTNNARSPPESRNPFGAFRCRMFS